MKITINTDKGEKEVELRNPKGRHTKNGFKLLTNVIKEDGTEDIGALNKYLDYLDEVAAEMSGLSVEELDDLEDEEKEKIVGFYNKKVRGKVDFLIASLSVPGSVPKEKKA